MMNIDKRIAITKAVALGGLTHEQAARAFNVSRPTVTKVVNGYHKPYNFEPGRAALTATQREQIARLADRLTYDEVASATGVSRSTVSRAWCGELAVRA